MVTSQMSYVLKPRSEGGSRFASGQVRFPVILAPAESDGQNETGTRTAWPPHARRAVLTEILPPPITRVLRDRAPRVRMPERANVVLQLRETRLIDLSLSGALVEHSAFPSGSAICTAFSSRSRGTRSKCGRGRFARMRAISSPAMMARNSRVPNAHGVRGD